MDHHRFTNSLAAAIMVAILVSTFAIGCSSQNETELASTTTLSTDPMPKSAPLQGDELASKISELEQQALAHESANRLNDAADVRAEIHSTISKNTSPNSWQAKTAGEIAEAAKRNSELDPQNAALLKNSQQLLTRLQNQIKFNESELARTTAEDIIAIYQRVYGIESLPVAQVLVQIANIEYKSPNTTAAISHFHRAIETFKKLDLRDHPQLEEAHMGLGALYARQEKFKPAISNQKAAARIAASAWGENSINYADQANQLGVMMHANGQAQAALKILMASATIRRSILGADDPKVAHSLLNVGTVQQDLKMFEEAIETYSLARKSFLASGQQETLLFVDKCSSSIATIFMLQNKLPEAEQLLGQVLAAAESANSTPAAIALRKYRYSIALARQGKYDSAQPLMEQALQVQQQQLGNRHPETLQTMQAYALLLKSTNQNAAAQQVYNVIQQVSYETESQEPESNDFQR